MDNEEGLFEDINDLDQLYESYSDVPFYLGVCSNNNLSTHWNQMDPRVVFFGILLEIILE